MQYLEAIQPDEGFHKKLTTEYAHLVKYAFEVQICAVSSVSCSHVFEWTSLSAPLSCSCWKGIKFQPSWMKASTFYLKLSSSYGDNWAQDLYLGVVTQVLTVNFASFFVLKVFQVAFWAWRVFSLGTQTTKTGLCCVMLFSLHDDMNISIPMGYPVALSNISWAVAMVKGCPRGGDISKRYPWQRKSVLGRNSESLSDRQKRPQDQTKPNELAWHSRTDFMVLFWLHDVWQRRKTILWF